MRLLHNKFYFFFFIIPLSCSQNFTSPEFPINNNKSEIFPFSFNSAPPAAQAMDSMADSPHWIGGNLLCSPK